MDQYNDWKKLWELFITFFKLGCFTFGGGYAMIPLIERELVTHKKWIASKDIVNIFAVSQSIPGAIAVNSSAFTGHRIAGKKGALIATAGVVLPSFIIIIVIATFFTKFQDNPWVQKAFLGIRTSIVALILLASTKIARSSIIDKLTASIAIITVLLLLFLKLHPAILILGGAFIGVLLYFFYPQRVKSICSKEATSDDLS